MTSPQEKAKQFQALHVKSDPVVLYNIWDVGSAKAVEEAGAKALATGSLSVAGSLGYGDGEKLPLELALAHVRQIVTSTNLPVTLDFEGAYARDPSGIDIHVRKALDTGVIGFNFEDQIVGTNDLHSIEEQTLRIGAMRHACETAGIAGFINARTDIFLKAPPATHSDVMLSAAIERARAYGAAGASGFFVPGLLDPNMIAQLCNEVTLPINVMALTGAPDRAALKQAGVSRISYGPIPWRKAMAAVQNDAREAFASN